MTSANGITWTARTPTAANSWRSVVYANGLWVAVSSDGTNRVMTSTDGITWTARTAAEANLWFSVAYGDGLLVAVAGSGTNRVMTSSSSYDLSTEFFVPTQVGTPTLTANSKLYIKAT
jgi:hypothetical protein